MLELVIDSVGISLENYERVAILREKEGSRCLLVWIGSYEAEAIVQKLENISMPRMLTHDLILSVIDTLGANVQYITISDLIDGVFYGKIVLGFKDRQTEIDCRPSDALALAIGSGSSIFIEENLLNQAGFYLDQGTGKLTPQERTKGKDVSQDEMKKMSAFADFINELDMNYLDD